MESEISASRKERKEAVARSETLEVSLKRVEESARAWEEAANAAKEKVEVEMEQKVRLYQYNFLPVLFRACLIELVFIISMFWCLCLCLCQWLCVYGFGFWVLQSFSCVGVVRVA